MRTKRKAFCSDIHDWPCEYVHCTFMRETNTVEPPWIVYDMNKFDLYKFMSGYANRRYGGNLISKE